MLTVCWVFSYLWYSNVSLDYLELSHWETSLLQCPISLLLPSPFLTKAVCCNIWIDFSLKSLLNCRWSFMKHPLTNQINRLELTFPQRWWKEVIYIFSYAPSPQNYSLGSFLNLHVICESTEDHLMHICSFIALCRVATMRCRVFIIPDGNIFPLLLGEN